MADRSSVVELSRLLEETAQAHHDATGGPDPSWESWYAEFLEGEIDAYLGFHPDVGQITEWLAQAAEKHEIEARDRPWPDYYAESILDQGEGAKGGG
ncbi:MAG: hypothetical protein ACRDZM_10685 [Acidimicrobiia bacterium]